MIGTENAVPERRGSMSVELRRNTLPERAKNENSSKNEDDEEVQRELLHDLPDWLQEFREKLVDESVLVDPRRDPSHRHRDTSSSSHELPTESRAKVEPGSGKHSVFYTLSEGPRLSA